jgi:hypothetical protein
MTGNPLTTDIESHDPIVVIYRQVEGMERITSLDGLPVLDLIARGTLPPFIRSLPPESVRVPDDRDH